MDYNMSNSPYRHLVVGVDTSVPLSDGRMVPYVNFDNAATTPPLTSVMRELNNFSPWYSSIHRGEGYKSQVSSRIYEDSRNIIMDFVKADTNECTAIFVKNTTEGINKLAFRLCNNEGCCTVLSTDMEHHSNDLPWRGKYKVEYVDLDRDGRLSLPDLELKLRKYNGCVKLLTVSGASNVTGFVNPIHDIARLAHQYNAKILVDGAQLVPHLPVDMKPVNSPEHIDFLVFSAHKMYAPFGTGVLIGSKADFRFGEPDYKGGGTVELVTHENVSWTEPPEKEEAGTPNLMGVVALVASIKTLSSIGMHNLENYERWLTGYALSRLKNMKDVQLYGSKNDDTGRVGIIPFNVSGIHHSILSKILSQEAGIGVRAGCFCAHPYIQKLLRLSPEEIQKLSRSPAVERPGMVRISFGIYNNLDEIDYFIRVLDYIIKNKYYFNEKYESIIQS